jgi:hypothetical protein
MILGRYEGDLTMLHQLNFNYEIIDDYWWDQGISFEVEILAVMNMILWRMSSSGMWHRVDLVWTNVSEELIASIFRVNNARARNQREQVATVWRRVDLVWTDVSEEIIASIFMV